MSRDRRDWIARFWLLALIVASLGGVYLFDGLPHPWKDRVIVYVVAMVFLTFMVFHTSEQASRED